MPETGQSSTKDNIFSGYENLLTDKERVCIRAKIQQFSWARAKEYLSTQGINISEGHYYRVLRAIKKKTQGRLYWFAIQGLEVVHLDTIDTLMVVESEYWTQYYLETDNYKKTLILDKIVNLQPWKSMYTEKTQDLMEKQLRSRKLAESTKPDTIQIKGFEKKVASK